MTTSIFFDLDGTLCDPRDGIVRCFQYALEQLGHAVPSSEIVEHYIGPPLHESFTALLNSNDTTRIHRAVELYRERFASKGVIENKIYPGIADLLTTLRERCNRLYVVTTKPTVFALQVLDQIGLSRCFLGVYGSELDGTRADKRDLIAHVLAQERIRSGDAIMIGDRGHDIKGALANGVRPMGVLWGYGSNDELIQAGATALCPTPQSILDQLG